MLKQFIKEKVFEPLSVGAVLDIVKADQALQEMWDNSFDVVADFSEHFALPVDSREVEHRIRLLVVAEACYVKQEIEAMQQDSADVPLTYADIGDADGSVRLQLQRFFNEDRLQTVGINLQNQAVKKMKAKGLAAICADALTIGSHGLTYDLVSVFETLEHLPDPVGFLTGINGAVKNRLVISVPFIRNSRISLRYLLDTWPKEKKPTIENTHIFELSPHDWRKLFHHTGWRVDREWQLMMYPAAKLSRLILQPLWRHVSFEGFWFVTLTKDDSFSSRYGIE